MITILTNFKMAKNTNEIFKLLKVMYFDNEYHNFIYLFF